jgi:hypothetical protein
MLCCVMGFSLSARPMTPVSSPHALVEHSSYSGRRSFRFVSSCSLPSFLMRRNNNRKCDNNVARIKDWSGHVQRAEFKCLCKHQPLESSPHHSSEGTLTSRNLWRRGHIVVAEVEALEVAKEGEGTSWVVALMPGVVTAFIPTGFLNLRTSRRMLKAASSFQEQLLLLSQT